MTLNYKNCFLVSFFLLGLNYLICNSPFLTYFFPFNLVKKYTKYAPTPIKVQPAIEYSEFKNPNFIATKANKFIAITQQTNINISLKKAFIFSFITKLQNY